MNSKLENTAQRSENRKQLIEQVRGDNKWFAVSNGQEALWFLQKQSPDNCAYNVAACIEIKSKLDVVKFRAALEAVLLTHEAINSRFQLRKGKLRHQINNNLSWSWQQISADGWSSDVRDTHMEEDYRRPFDLENGPLCRASLYQVSDNRWIFLLVFHHIIIDGWSLWTILDQLQHVYAGSKLELSTTKTYRDFVIQQRAFLKTSRANEQLQYWRTKLAKDLPVLQLPLDKTRPPQQTFRGAVYDSELSAETTVRLAEFCRRFQVTPFTLGLAVYSTLLHRFSGQSDMLIAIPAAGRDTSDYGDIVGYFVNSLPIRLSPEGEATFAGFLSSVKASVLDALFNQDIPFNVLVENLSFKRDPSYPSLCQTMFVYQKLTQSKNGIGFEDRDYAWGDLVARHYPLAQQAGQFDIALEILEGENQLKTHWKYNTDLFNHETILNLDTTFRRIVDAVIDAPDLKLAAIPLTGPETTGYLMRPPLASYAEARGLHEVFSETAKKFPDAVAVVDGNTRLTYAGLEQRGAEIQAKLQRQKVAPGEPIGIMMQRSADLIASILGVLRAGCCYVPMDPNYPEDRLAGMAADARVRHVLVASDADTTAITGISTIDVRECETIDDDGLAGAAPVHGNQLAYILYTSGSTGKPKGVKVSHANVLRLFKATENLYGFGPEDVWTLFHSYAFDFSVWEMWGALLYGGKLVIVTYEESRSPAEFRKLLQQHQVTVLNQTPSAFFQLVQQDLNQVDGHRLDKLKWIIFGGEALELSSLRPWFQKYGDTRPQLVNMYGITETTVHVTYRTIRLCDTYSSQSLIGQPLADLHIMILDKYRHPVPISFPGEIYVGGAGVSQGYWNREDLSSERFIDNPLLPGEKMYRTGDLARWVTQTDVAYLGRIDNQIQLRGFRIELGEVEYQICQYPGVSNALVFVDKDRVGNAILVAYFLVPDKNPLDWRKIRGFLKERLPEYMIPSAGVQLAEYPLTNNGKIDRVLLPKPTLGRSSATVGARDYLEQQIANIWSEVLGRSAIDITDNFFEIGGHSLLAAHLTQRLSNELKQEISIATLLKHNSIEKLANEVRSKAAFEWTPLVPLVIGPAQTNIFCIPGGSGNALYFLPLANALNQACSTFGLQSRGLDGKRSPHTSVEEIAHEHFQYIREQQPSGPYFLVGHCFGAIVALEIARLIVNAGHQVAALVVIDAPAPVPEHRPPIYTMEASGWLLTFVDIMAESNATDFTELKQNVSGLAFEHQLELCQQKFEELGILPPASDNKLLKGMVEVFKSNSQIAYRSDAHFEFPIVLIRASDYNSAFDYSAADDHSTMACSTLGWQKITSKPVRVAVVKGNHITMLNTSNVGQSADTIKECIAEWVTAAPYSAAIVDTLSQPMEATKKIRTESVDLV